MAKNSSQSKSKTHKGAKAKTLPSPASNSKRGKKSSTRCPKNGRRQSSNKKSETVASLEKMVNRGQKNMEANTSNTKRSKAGKQERDQDGTPSKKKIRKSAEHKVAASPASTVTTAASASSSNGYSLSSPDSQLTTASTRSRDAKTSSVMQNLNLSKTPRKERSSSRSHKAQDVAGVAKTNKSSVKHDPKLTLLTSDWSNSDHLLNLMVGSKYDIDPEEFLTMSFDEQLKKVMPVYKPKELLVLYSILSAKLGIIPTLDVFQTRAKGEKALSELIQDNRNVIKALWKR